MKKKEAIVSLNKAWDVLGDQGFAEALKNVGISKAAGCVEYCGSYGDCGGYCKPMSSIKASLGGEVINPADGINLSGVEKSAMFNV